MVGGADRDRPRRRLSRRPEPTPAQRALALLVRREHSRPELLRKLQARGIAPAEAAAAVERMVAEGWQDDRRFADSLVRHRVGAGYGPRYIRAELRLHEIPADIAAAVLQAREDQWTAIAARRSSLRTCTSSGA